MTTLTHLRVSLVLLLGLCTAAAGDDFGDQLERHFYPPGLLMTVGQEVGLSASQEQAVKAAIQTAQTEVVDIQWEMMEARRELIQAVSAKRPDVPSVLTLAQRVMDLEGRVKIRHLSLLVEIKLLLSEEQQLRLDELRPRQD